MHRALLGFAALAAVTPAAAPAAPFTGRPAVSTERLADACRGGERRGGRGLCRSDVVMDWYGGEWALYNNRSFAPDSYNDWWHDRPDRAYPAWMRRNQDCQRQWFSGDVLTC